MVDQVDKACLADQDVKAHQEKLEDQEKSFLKMI